MAEFKDRLKQLRKERNMTQAMLSKQLNYGYTAIANYESGRNEPTISTLKQLAEIFHTSVDYLIGSSDERFSHKHLAGQNEIGCLYDIIPHLDHKGREKLFSFAEWLLFKE